MLTLLVPLLWGALGSAVCESGDLAEWAEDGRSFQFCLDPDQPVTFGFAGSFNVSTCPDSNLATASGTGTTNDGDSMCWWDTSMESRCMTGVCIWDTTHWNAASGGACYCKEYDTAAAGRPCNACVDPDTGDELTPAPTFDIEESPCDENCQIYDLGCGSEYCMCHQNGRTKCKASCPEPVNPHCWLWGPGGPPPPSPRPTPAPTDEPTPRPTYAPTSDMTVMWELKVCCMTNTQVLRSTASVARALGLQDTQVRVNKMSRLDARRRTDDASEYSAWQLEYAIEASSSSEAARLKQDLRSESSIDALQAAVAADLGVTLSTLDTVAMRTSLTSTSDQHTSDSGGDSNIVLIAVVGAALVVALAAACAWRTKRGCWGRRLSLQSELLAGMDSMRSSPRSDNEVAYSLVAQHDTLMDDRHMRVVN